MFNYLIKGKDGQGESLGNYSPTTISIKQAKGQRTDHITLKDTGDFYSSYRLSLNGLVTANTQKEDTDLAVEFGKDILTLSDEGQDVMIQDFLLEDVQNFIRKEIC